MKSWQLSLFDDEGGPPPPDAAVPGLPQRPPAAPAPHHRPPALPGRPRGGARTAPPAPMPAPACTPSASTPSTDAAPAGRPAPSSARAGADWRSVLLGGEPVPYHFRRARRRSIGFTIGAEGLRVAAPRWVSIGAVEQALRDKADWILRKLALQRERAAQVEAMRVEWRDGAALPFLGETVTLRLDPSVTGVQLRGAEAGSAALVLHVGLPPGAAGDQVRDAVQGWLQRQARRVFEERIAHFAPRLGVKVGRMALSSATTRWGSARADGSVWLNWRLVHFSLPVIDYVVAHELSHLRVMDHSPAFWSVVESVMPDYKAQRGALRHGIVPAL